MNLLLNATFLYKVFLSDLAKFLDIYEEKSALLRHYADDPFELLKGIYDNAMLEVFVPGIS